MYFLGILYCEDFLGITSAVMKYDFYTLPGLLEKLVFCTQTDTWIHRQTDRQVDSNISPKTFLLRGYNNESKMCINSLLKDKYLDLTKFKELTDNKFYVAKKIIAVCDWV